LRNTFWKTEICANRGGGGRVGPVNRNPGQTPGGRQKTQIHKKKSKKKNHLVVREKHNNRGGEMV